MPDNTELSPSLDELFDTGDSENGGSKETPEQIKAKEDALIKDKEDKEEADKLEKEKASKEKEDLLKKEKEDKSKKDEEEGSEEGKIDPKEDDELTIAKGFWEDVQKITGEKLDVDFGDSIPDTPEGAAKFVQAFRDKGIESFEEGLKAKFPREYRALELAAEGLDPSSLYKEQVITDYSKITITEKDLNIAKDIYSQSLRSKGNSDEDIADLVKVAEDKGKLLEKGKAALTELQENQKNNEKELDAKTSGQIAEKKRIENNYIALIEQTVNKGEVGDFIIPEKDRKALIDKVLGNTENRNGKFYIVEEITEKDLNSKIQAEYFKLKAGNLSDLVKRKASTERVAKLRRTIAEADKKPKGSSEGKFGSPSLQDLTED